MRRHVVGEPDVTSNDGVVAYAHTAEDGGVGVDGYVVLDYGVARLVDGVSLQVVVEIARAEGDALVEHHMAANDGGLAYDDAGAVVDGEILANLGGGVYVDACGGVRHLGDDAWQEGDAEAEERVGGAIMHHGLHHGIAKDGLGVVGGGRVVLRDGGDVGEEQALYLRKLLHERERETLGLRTRGRAGGAAGGGEAVAGLLQKEGEDSAGIDIDAMAEELGEDGAFDVVDELTESLDVGQLIVAAEVHFFLHGRDGAEKSRGFGDNI